MDKEQSVICFENKPWPCTIAKHWTLLVQLLLSHPALKIKPSCSWCLGCWPFRDVLVPRDRHAALSPQDPELAGRGRAWLVAPPLPSLQPQKGRTYNRIHFFLLKKTSLREQPHCLGRDSESPGVTACPDSAGYLCPPPCSPFSLIISPISPIMETTAACRGVRFLKVPSWCVAFDGVTNLDIEINRDELLLLTHSYDLNGNDQNPSKWGSRKECLFFQLSQTGHRALTIYYFTV